MKSDRPYVLHDLRVLKGFRAPIEDDDFHELYLREHDVWCRGKHDNAEMPEGTLHRLVVDWERKSEAKTKAAPKKELQKA